MIYHLWRKKKVWRNILEGKLFRLMQSDRVYHLFALLRVRFRASRVMGLMFIFIIIVIFYLAMEKKNILIIVMALLIVTLTH